MPNIIFLDIDGVLNTQKHLRRQERHSGARSSHDWSPAACRHVVQLCQEHEARIVVSSTWRYHHDLEELREFFADNGIDPELVTDTTPSLLGREQPGMARRGDAIARWLEKNDLGNSNGTGTYVIIDDLPTTQFHDAQQPHLVVVEPDKGFAEEGAYERAVWWK